MTIGHLVTNISFVRSLYGSIWSSISDNGFRDSQKSRNNFAFLSIFLIIPPCLYLHASSLGRVLYPVHPHNGLSLIYFKAPVFRVFFLFLFFLKLWNLSNLQTRLVRNSEYCKHLDGLIIILVRTRLFMR